MRIQSFSIISFSLCSRHTLDSLTGFLFSNESAGSIKESAGRSIFKQPMELMLA